MTTATLLRFLPFLVLFVRTNAQFELFADTTVGDQGDDMVNVIIGYHKDAPTKVLRGVPGGGLIKKKFRRINAVATSVPASDIPKLENDPAVAYVELDREVHLLSEGGGGEEVGYEIPLVQADTDKIPLPSNEDDCFKICVVDAGMYEAHPDLPFKEKHGNVQGKEFDLPPGQHWWNPVEDHGTHVTGIIAARGGNDRGTVGVIPKKRNICMLVARAFGDFGVGSTLSAVEDAMEWCADEGARVINMSLGGPIDSSSSRDLIEDLVDDGILVVSAAGNAGTSESFYPASYDGVLSVASVDENSEHSYFSNYNDGVDLSAPGSGIKSTVPSERLRILNEDTGAKSEFAYLQDSLRIATPATVDVADCGLGKSRCNNVNGKICLLQRGEVPFGEKAQNCHDGGGVGAIIANSADEEGVFLGVLNTYVPIPVMAVSHDDGQELEEASTVSLELLAADYKTLSGTSMATPVVTGVAARIWAARPQCTNHQIREALESTALDLGDDGRDDEYGHGLVQAEAAYEYLLDLPEPCGDGER